MRQLLTFVLLITIFSGSIAQNWDCIGPFEVPQSGLDSGHWSANGIGWIESIAVAGRKDKRVYAGSNVGGFFFSKDQGNTWESRFDDKRICGVWDIEVGTWPGRVWIGTGTNTWDTDWGHGVLYSSNNGKRWKSTGLSFDPTDKQVVYALERSKVNKKVFYACTETDVFKSTDKTKTWENILNHDDTQRVHFRHLKLHNTDVQKVVASGTELFTSTDGGNTWKTHSDMFTFQQVNNGRDSLPGRYAVALNPLNNNQLMVVYSYRRINYIDRSNDFGKTWFNVHTSRDFDRVDMNHAELIWDDRDTSVIYVGGVRLYRSINSGKSFSLSTQPVWGAPNFMHDDIRSFTQGKRGLWIGNDGGVSLSSDQGISWIDRSGAGLTATQFYDIAVENGIVVGGCQDLSTLILKDGKWHHTTLIYGDGSMNLIDGEKLYIMHNGSRIRTGDTSNTAWGMIYTPYSPNRFKYPFEFHPETKTKLWLTDHDLWQYDLTSKRWKNLTKSIPHGFTKIVAMDYSETSVYLAKDQPTWSTDSSAMTGKLYIGILSPNGYFWTDITASLGILAWREITSIEINPQNDNHLVVSLYGLDADSNRFRVYESLDGGETWRNISQGLPNCNALDVLFAGESNHLYLATDDGVFRYNDNKSWERFGVDLPRAHIIDLEYDNSTNTLYAATFGNGVWRCRITD